MTLASLAGRILPRRGELRAMLRLAVPVVVVQGGVLLAVILAIPSIAVLLVAQPALALARQPTEVVPLAAAYILRLAPGVLPFFLFIVFRQSLQALRRTAPIVISIVVANLVN